MVLSLPSFSGSRALELPLRNSIRYSPSPCLDLVFVDARRNLSMKRAGCIALAGCLCGLMFAAALLHPIRNVAAQEPQEINLDGPFLLPPPPPDEAPTP